MFIGHIGFAEYSAYQRLSDVDVSCNCQLDLNAERYSMKEEKNNKNLNLNFFHHIHPKKHVALQIYRIATGIDPSNFFHLNSSVIYDVSSMVHPISRPLKISLKRTFIFNFEMKRIYAFTYGPK